MANGGTVLDDRFSLLQCNLAEIPDFEAATVTNLRLIRDRGAIAAFAYACKGVQ